MCFPILYLCVRDPLKMRCDLSSSTSFNKFKPVAVCLCLTIYESAQIFNSTPLESNET